MCALVSGVQTCALPICLPVVFAGNAIIVEDSQFDALGPGRLSIRIPALRQALAGGGETVEAAVKALEDFHYEELTLTLAKTAANDATVKTSTLGQNPDVMDGQRSAERRAGTECVSTCRSRWLPYT